MFTYKSLDLKVVRDELSCEIPVNNIIFDTCFPTCARELFLFVFRYRYVPSKLTGEFNSEGFEAFKRIFDLKEFIREQDDLKLIEK